MLVKCAQRTRQSAVDPPRPPDRGAQNDRAFRTVRPRGCGSASRTATRDFDATQNIALQPACGDTSTARFGDILTER